MSLRRRVPIAFVITLLIPLIPACSPRPAEVLPGIEFSGLFRDSAAESGVDFLQVNGADGKFHFIESTPPGGALFDFDNDGWLDLFVVQPGPSVRPESVTDRPHCALYRNNRDGRFTNVTAGSGFDVYQGYTQGAFAADYDNDGFEDLFITSFGRNRLFHNESGTGTFADVTDKMGLGDRHSTGYSTSAAFGDINNDGRLDLYICYYCPWTWEKDKPCKSGTGERDYCSPDVYEYDTHQLFRNDGDRFTDVSAESGIGTMKGRGLAVAFIDYDQDGWQDIFVANDLSANMLWRNNGDGTFTDRGQEAGCAFSEGGQNMAAMGIGIADYDHSGFPSLFVTNFSGLPNTLFKNIGGMFQDVATSSGLALPHMPFLAFGCEFLDYNLDGWADLLVANGHVQKTAGSRLEGTTYKERKQLFRNRGDGTFQEITGGELGDLASMVISRGLAVGDIDNDGLPDAVAFNQNDKVQVFKNHSRNPHHWIMFKTIGTKSNRDGRHARIEIESNGIRQTSLVRAGSSYLSTSDKRVHFGIGDAKRVDRAEVRWPSGVRNTLENLEPDAIYTITEGRGITGRQDASKKP